MLSSMKDYKWTLDPRKYLTEAEAQLLLQSSQRAAEQATRRGGKIPIRNYFLVCLALSTGLRVGEIAQLVCGDLSVHRPPYNVWVRHGKGDRERIVYIKHQFKEQCLDYLQWKARVGEPTDSQAPLFYSSNTQGHLTVRALQNVFKKQAAIAKLPTRYSIHATRHTYACQLYRVSGKDLRLVQKQLGHANIKITEVYADVMVPDIEQAVEHLTW